MISEELIGIDLRSCVSKMSLKEKKRTTEAENLGHGFEDILGSMSTFREISRCVRETIRSISQTEIEGLVEFVGI